jgi:hypothetical protein
MASVAQRCTVRMCAYAQRRSLAKILVNNETESEGEGFGFQRGLISIILEHESRFVEQEVSGIKIPDTDLRFSGSCQRRGGATCIKHAYSRACR